MYSYQRHARVASDERHTSYAESVSKAQAAFTGAIAEGVYDYITTLHKRIGRRAPWEGIPGFQSWDYGSPRPLRTGYQIRVWQKDSSIYPRGIDPVIHIDVDFAKGVNIGAALRGVALFAKHYVSGDVTPSSVALQIGAAWENLLTGTVDYGD